MSERLLELFAGSGVVSKYFRDRGWEATEVEIQRGSDVMTWEPDGWYRGVWSSPVCVTYSYVRTYNKHTGEKYAYHPDLSQWRRTLDLIDLIRPDWYVVENVLGAQRSWGPPTYKFGPWCLWTNLEIEPPNGVPGKGKLVWDRRFPTTRRTAVIPEPVIRAVFEAAMPKGSP
jgi:hypothetical protein